MTKSTSGGCGQFETSPETIDPELRTAFCERGQTDRLKTNYSVDTGITEIHPGMSNLYNANLCYTFLY